MIKAFKFFTVTASANCLEKVLSPLMLKDDAGQEDGDNGTGDEEQMPVYLTLLPQHPPDRIGAR